MTQASPSISHPVSARDFSWPSAFWGLLLPLIVYAALSVRTLTSVEIPFDTQYNYLPFARQILEDAQVFWNTEMSLRAAPGIAVYMALADADLTVVKMLNLGLALGSVVLLFQLSQRLAGNIAGAATAWLMALSPMFVELSVLPQVEGPTFFLTTLWLWATAWCFDKGTTGARLVIAVVLAGLALAALTLTRATLMYWMPAIILFSVAAYLLPKLAGRTVPWLRVALVHGIALACVGSYMARNANEFDKPVIAAGAGAALYFGNLSTTHGQEPPYFGLAHDQSFITKDVDHLTLKGDARLNSTVKRMLADRPLSETAGLYVQKLGDILFFSKSHLRNYSDRIWRVLLIVFSLAALWLGRRQPMVLLVGGVLAYMTAVHIPVLYNQRYSVGALDIELMLLAGTGLGLILQQKHRWRALSAVLGIFAVGALLGAAHQRYTQPLMLDINSVPLRVSHESPSAKAEFKGFESSPFEALAPMTTDTATISWTDTFPEIESFTLFHLQIKQLQGECTKAWLSFTDGNGVKRRDFVRISSLRDGLDFNRGMAHIASPVAGGKIELTLQCSRGTRMHLQRMQLLEGTPGKYLLKQAERQ